MNKANAGIETMKAWANLCPENFLHKALLLQAIREGFKNNPDEAIKIFEQAAEKAMESGFVQDCGLAYEHLARMQKRLGSDHKKAIQQAIDAYTKWGADGKVAYLHSEFDVQ
jgi:tetratricopeptide (TPR) repeat protein